MYKGYPPRQRPHRARLAVVAAQLDAHHPPHPAHRPVLVVLVVLVVVLVVLVVVIVDVLFVADSSALDVAIAVIVVNIVRRSTLVVRCRRSSFCLVLALLPSVPGTHTSIQHTGKTVVTKLLCCSKDDDDDASADAGFG